LTCLHKRRRKDLLIWTWMNEKRMATNHRRIIIKNYPQNRPRSSIGLWDIKDPTLSKQLAHRWRRGCQPYAPAPQKFYFYATGTNLYKTRMLMDYNRRPVYFYRSRRFGDWLCLRRQVDVAE
jgi:hypothetical protein